jgi:hypothetical protein
MRVLAIDCYLVEPIDEFDLPANRKNRELARFGAPSVMITVIDQTIE